MAGQIVLVGTPNVGKSVIFNYLTGRYANVSNYPGTTVEIAQGRCKLKGLAYDVIDTPGLYSLTPLTEEEQVTRALLFRRRPELVIHVLDAKNISRMLNLTLELLDGGFPVLLDVNMMDEAAAAGIQIDFHRLSRIIDIPVVATAAAKKAGLDDLAAAIAAYQPKKASHFSYSEEIEELVEKVSGLLTGEYGVSQRLMALLLLQADKSALKAASGEPSISEISAVIENVRQTHSLPFAHVIAAERQAVVNRMLQTVIRQKAQGRRVFSGIFDRLTREPVTGIPLLILVLYFGLYKFVGGFGAGVLVDYLDTVLFKQVLNPLIFAAAESYLPWDWMKSMLIGEYGLFNMGVRYAVAIIMPVVGTFFLMFAFLEDCGYLPRLALLADGVFKRFGLNGRAVIPVTLGLGCGTMAVVVARTLETKRERLLATFLLALAVPCSAQLGVVLALLSSKTGLVAVWAAYIISVFCAVGWLSAKVLPGARSPFYMELPPLRLPSLKNVFTKAYTRMVWYLAEIIPVFVFASIAMWLGAYTGALEYIIKAAEAPLAAIGLPNQTAEAFLLGFFRRDYGAAGLYDLVDKGLLDDRQILVAAVTLTLFVPCVAQVLVMVKERGIAATMIMLGLITVIAYSSGWLVWHVMSGF